MSGPLHRATTAAAVAASALTLHSLVNWRLLRTPPQPPGDATRRPRLSVLIPARDEASRIGPTLQAVLAQEDVQMEVLVLDDGSTDGTADVVRQVAGDDRRVRLLTGGPLPEGWLGKPHACWQLANRATGEVLVFLDADVALQPGALAACADLMAACGLDLVSPYPRQQVEGVAQRLIQPLLQWSWLTFLPLRLAERTSSPSMTAANGQLLLARTSAYRASTGHAAVRDDVIEDVGLARAFKRAGFTAGMADGTPLATCRMYEGWTDMRDGYAKSLWSAFGSPAGAMFTMALLGWLYVLPPVAALVGVRRRDARLAAVGVAGWAAASAGRAHGAWRTGGRPADAPAHPLSVLLLAGLTAASFWRRRRGSLEWKGRPVT